ncbi:ASST-domain-containing protein [Aspergillus pseudotamarii]|uniref:ASST-domain-containing protein n=1 Tax=Aspergillus pseudotamarii TaxID=132259 RepID=A0A5N6SGU4_ASPPS|nr:ASST-domain-containing protein [Aspergillus pseudotamarii]KAE8133117.1 ASST-domain-containing protein [Aspergillus pseudotamarii]
MKFSTVLSLFISGAAIASALPSSAETVEADCIKPYLCCGELKTPLDSTVDPILEELGINAASIVGSIGLACMSPSTTRAFAMPGTTRAKLHPSAALKLISWVAQLLLDAQTSSPSMRMERLCCTSGALISILTNNATDILEFANEITASGLIPPRVLACLDGYATIDLNSTHHNNPSSENLSIYPYKAKSDAPYSIAEHTLRVAIHIPRSFSHKQDKKIPVLTRNAESVAYALNCVSALTSSKIAVISWSQGALDIQWALKYWPSTRNVVSDFIAISPDFPWNNTQVTGMPQRGRLCVCSHDHHLLFIRQGRETHEWRNASARLLDYRGVGVSNNQLQTICANKTAGGFYTYEGVLYNPLAWALTVDALRHDGPGNITRINTQKLPQVRALKFDITYHDRDSTLIWAGSCLYDNRNIFDFKAVPNIDGGSHLSFILQHAYRNNDDDKGTGYVLDQHYETEKVVPVTNDLGAFNMHEFNILDGGMTALACAYRNKYMSLGDIGRPDEYGWVVTGGFVELDTATGEVLFEWDSEGYIPIDESVKVGPSTPASGEPGWDYIHVNAVDKNAAGDYILSARFTSTIYLISGQDKSIIWRLGGEKSDFVQDFTFSKQHHVRFVESNATHTTISFLNNASDEVEQEEDTSAALIVQLHTSVSPMTAKVIERYNRPDGDLTRLRGSVQKLPNGNVFVGWSERGYQSEHSPYGKLLMEARFASSRFSTYRSYKFDFTGRPSAPPDVVSSVYGTDETDLTTIFHVSWNGATDVTSWNFYARVNQDGMPVLIGNTTKLDFETMYIVDGYLDWVSVEAVDEDGNVLGASKIQRTETPSNWRLAGFQGDIMPAPHDPSILYGDRTIADNDDDDTEDTEEVYLKAQKAAETIYKAWEVIRGVGGLLILVLFLCSTGGLLAGMYCYFRRRNMQAYHQVASEEGQPLNERSI